MVVVDASAGRVHRLTGPSAAVVRAVVLEGTPVADLPAALVPAVDELRASGILRGGVSRRSALGAVGSGAFGIMTLALPSAAAAATGGGGGGGSAYDNSTDGSLTLPSGFTAAAGYAYRTFTSDGTFVVGGSGSLAVDVLLVGAGGGGGGYDCGGGGAGGAVSRYFAQSLAFGTHAVTVGAGGGGGYYGSGDAGGQSGLAGVGIAPGGSGGRESGGDGGDVAAGWPLGVGSAAGTRGAGNGTFGGGGAGAGGDGQSVADAAANTGGAGGDAFTESTFFGAEVDLGGGGGGGGYFAGGDAGAGGGAGGAHRAEGGAATSFGGGGGGPGFSSGQTGGSGFDGLVVIRYASS